MADIEDRVDAIEKAVNLLLLQGTATDAPTTPTDSTWTCDSCGSLLGVYDPEEDVVRRKYKDDVSYVTLGSGGFITAVCRKCACPVTLRREDLDSMREAQVRRALS